MGSATFPTATAAVATMPNHWIWKSLVAGLSGAAAHSLLMFLKSWIGLLPTFQPYDSLQRTLSHLIGTEVHPLVPWALSFVSGATIIGFIFGRSYRFLPGENGATKGLTFGLVAWVMMGLMFFPLIGLGLFSSNIGLGFAPAIFSLAMLLTYSVVMGVVYAALNV
ncbi:MAG TPA: DUF6789 family protein [Candidatus Binataceae bacterium]|nr:DUF6789 family protein [Candidatus Binataceae bacterium]